MRPTDRSDLYDDSRRGGRETRTRTRRILVSLLVAAAFCAGELAPLALAQTGEESVEAQKGARKHRKRLKRPIALGTSGGNVNDFVIEPPFILCSSGTLGALVEKNGERHILSNNHVLAMTNKGTKGDPINQPGNVDSECQARENDFVADLSGYKRIKLNRTNKVDLALARVREGMVAETGEILKIGTPGNETAPPELGRRVKKSGRTTGITKGEIVVTETVVLVEFAAVGTSQTSRIVRFKEQMVISDLTGAFSSSGDSGAVVYEDVGDCPRAVGLLFAGGDGFAVANHMDTVLKVAAKIKPRGEVTLVGCTPMAPTGAMAGGAGSARKRMTPDRAEVLVARRARKAHENAMLSVRGIVGIGIGAGSVDPSRAVLKILIEEPTPELLERIPARLAGVPTEVMVTGRFRAF